VTQKALMIDICRRDPAASVLRETNSIRHLSPTIRDRVEAEYTRREAPLYQGEDEKVADPAHHAHVYLRNCLRQGWLLPI
jgi:hypothetical protein